MITKVPPVVAQRHARARSSRLPTSRSSGTGMLIAAIIFGFIIGFSPAGLVRAYGQTIWVVRYSLITIAAMLAIGTLTRYSGVDATLGLAFANAGFLYPFFGTLLGWLGVALTRSVPPRTCCLAACRRSPPAARGVAEFDGRGQFVRRRDGQIDRCPVHRGGFHRDQLVGHEGSSAVLFFQLHRVGLPGRVLVMLQAYLVNGMVVQ